jgi:hypothetical protein
MEIKNKNYDDGTTLGTSHKKKRTQITISDTELKGLETKKLKNNELYFGEAQARKSCRRR